MRKLVYIVVAVIALSSQASLANSQVESFIKSKRASAQLIKTESSKKIAYYKYLQSQGKPILSGMTYGVKVTRLQEPTIDTDNLDGIQTASGESIPGALTSQDR